MRTLAIDLGTRRVGLALSDAAGKIGTPLTVLQVTSEVQAIEKILPIVVEEGVERIVVGLPLNMDDSIGPAARGAIAFGKSLASRSGKPVIFVDERLSSFQAEQDLIDRKRGGEKITRKSKKQRLDALAAAVFLEAFLQGKLPAIAVKIV
jgi:putative Holliday junction resolvase